MLVEEWLTSLALAPKSKGHVRSIMHILFNWAMKWEYIDIDRMNPISLVRVEGSSKLRQPRILSVREFRLLLDHLQEPIRTMCIVAACLGLRASELVGLQCCSPAHMEPDALVGPIGWQSFRHSYSTLLRSLQVDLKVQQELLRHSDIRTTMNIYTRAVPDAMREANSKVVEMVLPMRKVG